MASKLWCFIRGSQKAITGAVVAGVLYVANRYQLHLGAGWETTATALVTAAFIYVVPNQGCTEA